MKKVFAIVAPVVVLALSGGSVRANVIDPMADSALKPDVKLREDVASQVAKYTLCLVKAEQKCEKGGSTSQVECHLATGVVDFEPTPGKYTQKFQAAVLKCDTKIDLTKKGTDYAGIGCPGDCNAAPGVQECADLPAFQGTITSSSSSSAPKSELPLLSGLIDGACATDNPGKLPTDAVRIACVTDNAKALTKYAQGLFKCEGKCENDFKNKFGNGGFTNDDECAAGVSSDSNFNACESAALIKAGTLSPHVLSSVVPALRAVINSGIHGLYDRFDPTSSPSDTPCGNCGNNVREGAESCDGSDDGICTMGCKPDCTCN